MSNPKHKPSEEQRKTVKAMTAYGLTQIDVAAVIGIDPKTLRLHYGRELEVAQAEANAAVAQSLFSMATKGKNVTAAIFWAKTRMGWKETIRVGGEDGKPIPVAFRWADAIPQVVTDETETE